MNSEQRRAHIVQAFMHTFGSAPTIWARAPGRVDLMGSHTDYNLGYVMTMAVDRDTWVAARPRADRRVDVVSLNLPGRCTFSLNEVTRPDKQAPPWAAYICGLARVLLNAGHFLSGFDGMIHSTLPLGGGLSSSAALEVATAVIFQQVSGFQMEPLAAAQAGQRAENEFVGVNCGILDQYSSMMGRPDCALLLDCRSLTSADVPISSDVQVVICDTKAERHLTGTEYDERRRQCEEGVRLLQHWQPNLESLRDVSSAFFAQHQHALPDMVARRCQFIIEENQRVLYLHDALTRGDTQQLAQLFEDSYIGARDLYAIGAPAMEAMMAAIQQGSGVIAARQAGAGFGGCMVALVDPAAVEDFIVQVTQHYTAATAIEPSIYAVRAASGAGMI